MKRASWFAIHSWVGIKLIFVLGVVLLSGTLATVSHEIDWLLNPALRVTPQQQPVAWEAMVRNVKRTYPDAVIHTVTGPRHPWHAAQITVTLAPDTQREHIYANPYTGELTGRAGWMTVQRFLRNLHMMLFLPDVGLYVVSAFGFLLLASMISGLVVYKRFWRGWLKWPRFAAGARVAWGDAHRLIGLWSLWFVALMAVTGIWYFIEMGLYDTGRGYADTPRAAPTDTAPAADARVDLDVALEQARQAYPGFRPTALYWPHRAGQALDVVGEADTVLVRERANRVYLSQVDGRVLGLQRGHELPLIYRWVHTADPLHFGTLGGLATQLLWFVFGLVMTVLTFSGGWLWFKRTRRALAAERAELFDRQPA